MVILTAEPLDVNALISSVRGPDCGAVVCFLGCVRRDKEGSSEVTALEYEAQPRMAQEAMERIAGQSGSGTVRLSIAHRTGRLEAGEISAVIVAASPHRAEAFEACRSALEQLKESVPIWKKMHFSSGESRWAEGKPLA